jgi:hypothetical protein
MCAASFGASGKLTTRNIANHEAGDTLELDRGSVGVGDRCAIRYYREADGDQRGGGSSGG